MFLLNICSLLLAVITTSLAAPSPQRHRPSAHTKSHPQMFFLRANCPEEPWHGRHIVSLPTSHQLGLENFTVAPTTPPLEFRPMKLPGGTYALRGSGDNDDSGRAPFLVALKSTTGTRTASMTILMIDKPTRRHSFAASVDDACWEGYECAAGEWNFDGEDGEGVHANVRFVGYAGQWEPMKDAPHGEGWHVYWKGEAMYHPIQLDLVPADEHDD